MDTLGRLNAALAARDRVRASERPTAQKTLEEAQQAWEAERKPHNPSDFSEDMQERAFDMLQAAQGALDRGDAREFLIYLGSAQRIGNKAWARACRRSKPHAFVVRMGLTVAQKADA